jgi:hypothetical protein
MRLFRALILVSIVALAAASSVSAADTRPPVTTITSGPFESSSDKTATFTFVSDEPGVSFQCSLDKGPISACSSPKKVTGLKIGSHTFYARSTDSSGNVGKPATVTWTVLAAPDPQPIPPPPPGGGGGGGGGGGPGAGGGKPGAKKAVARRCSVPRLRGKTLVAARRALKRANCRLGKVTRGYAPKVKRGRVVRSLPKSGKKRAKGAKVRVVLSRGAPRR